MQINVLEPHFEYIRQSIFHLRFFEIDKYVAMKNDATEYFNSFGSFMLTFVHCVDICNS